MVQKIIYKDQLRNIRSLLFHFLKVRMFWMKNTNTNQNNYKNKKTNPSWKPFEKFKCSWSTYSPDCLKLGHLTVFSALEQNFKGSSFPKKKDKKKIRKNDMKKDEPLFVTLWEIQMFLINLFTRPFKVGPPHCVQCTGTEF